MKSCLDCGEPSRGKRCVPCTNIHEAQSRKVKVYSDRGVRWHGFKVPAWFQADRITPSSVYECPMNRGGKVSKKYA